MGNPFHRGPYAYGVAGGSSTGFIADLEDTTGSVLYPSWKKLEAVSGKGDVGIYSGDISTPIAGNYIIEWRGFVNFVWGYNLIFGVSKNAAYPPDTVGQVQFASNSPAFVFKNFAIQAGENDRFTFLISTDFEYAEFSVTDAQVGGYKA